jgi:SEC-C motif-containing protein
MKQGCDCGDEAPYERCCGPLHEGRAHADSAERLMRSRYAAFARGEAHYLCETWRGPSAPELAELKADLEAQRERGERWVKLKVISASGEGLDERGAVQFEASLCSAAQLITLSELSQFERDGARWFYVGGAPQLTSRKLKRNESCPCESGQKWKRCCGAPQRPLGR